MMKPRQFATYLSLCFLAVSSIAFATELSFRSEYLPYESFSLEQGEAVPTQLLGELAAKAEWTGSIVKKFASREEIYRDEKRVKSFDYLLAETSPRKMEAIRFKGRKRAGFTDSFPPALAWGLLFSETNRTFFAYRYLGQSLDGPDLTHTISFRGIFSFKQGTDIREWEGVVIVDAANLEIIKVEAVPRIYAQVLKVKRDRYLRSFKIGFFGVPIRFRRAPRVQVLQIEFGDVPVEDLSEALETEAIVSRFPSTLVWQDYKVNSGGQLVRKKTEERRYSEYRFFDTGTRALEYAGSVGN